MAKAIKIDSNITGARYALESSLGTLPPAADQEWRTLQPNSYTEWGPEVTTVARNPINPSRQRQKGMSVDLDASGGLNSDFTQRNLEDLMQGFFFADLRRKNEFTGDIEAVGLTDTYEATNIHDGFAVSDLILAEGFVESANNGLKQVVGVAAGEVEVAETLVDEGPTEDAKLNHVGFQFGTGEVELVNPANALPYLNRASGTKDFTDFGLVPGEWIHVGGDAADHRFDTAAGNGFYRVRRIASDRITFDKTPSDPVADGGSGKEIRVFFGRVLKNESDPSLIRRRSYTIERTLGASDTSEPGNEQAEYLIGAVANEFTMQINSADKIESDLSFIAIDYDTRDENDQDVTLRSKVSGVTRVPEIDEDAFNTSTDFNRIRLSRVVENEPFPEPLFAFAEEVSITVNNNMTPNKAISVFGAFEMTAGTFEVGGNIQAYFADVAANAAVRENADVTLDIVIATRNAGLAIDMPLISLGDGRNNVEQDEAIRVPLENMAGRGRRIDPNMDHTMLWVFFPYLPTAAEQTD